MPRTRPLPLSTSRRRLLFQALARAEHAGVPVAQALDPLRAGARGRLAQRLDLMCAALERGVPLGDAGRRAGLFTPWEGRLLDSAARAGTVEAVLARLAEHHATRARWQARVRNRLALPLLLLVLFALIAPLPALVAQRIDGAGYLIRALLPIGLLALAWLLLAHVARRRHGHDLPRPVERLLLRLPGIGRMLRLRAQRDLLMNLALLLAAGRPAVEALREAAATVRNPVLRGAWTQAAADVERGATVTEALAGAGGLDRRAGVPLVGAGEFAGSLDRMVEHHAEALNERLDLADDALAEWLPRLLYFGVLALLAYGVVRMAW
ncbi:MAG: type II secretion system F family protein [Gammaproteobacteria bacterium]|nr:type II secretion system F family protein [Gammaproteobacteria bacterium]